jgi:hypothetical protein
MAYRLKLDAGPSTIGLPTRLVKPVGKTRAAARPGRGALNPMPCPTRSSPRRLPESSTQRLSARAGGRCAVIRDQPAYPGKLIARLATIDPTPTSWWPTRWTRCGPRYRPGLLHSDRTPADPAGLVGLWSSRASCRDSTTARSMSGHPPRVERERELAAVVELRRHFPLIHDNEQARACVRTIAGWKPLTPKPPRARRSRRDSWGDRPGVGA